MVPSAAEILSKISTASVGRTIVTDRQTTDRQTNRHTDGQQHYSEREREFTFAIMTPTLAPIGQ